MNKRLTSIGLTVGLVAGGTAGAALGLTRIAGAGGGPTNLVAGARAATGTTDQPGDAPTTDSAAAEPSAPDVEGSASDTGTNDDDGRTGQGEDPTHAADGPPRRGDEGPRGPGAALDAAATALGTTPEELRTSLQSGQTIAQLAAAKGVDPQIVIDAIVAAWTAREQEEVAVGEHTQEEVDARLADLTAGVTAMVNDTTGPGTGDATDGGPDGDGDDHEGDRYGDDHHDGDHPDDEGAGGHGDADDD